MSVARPSRRFLAVLFASIVAATSFAVVQGQTPSSAASTDKCGSANLTRDGWVKTKKTPPRLYKVKQWKEGVDYASENPYAFEKAKTSLGKMELYWHAATKRNCLVVVRTGSAAGHSGQTEGLIMGSTGEVREVGKDRTFKRYSWVTAYSPGCATVMGAIEHDGSWYANWFKQC